MVHLEQPHTNGEKHLTTEPPVGLDEDTEFLALIAEEQKELEKELGHGPISIEEARKILSKVPGSMADDIIADRGDR